MQKRYVPVVIFAVVLMAVAGVGYLMPEPEQKVPERILLDNAAGKVVFNHQKHLADDALTCASCHHEMIVEKENAMSCSSCHGIAFNEAFRVSHTSQIQGPDACATCHHMEFAKKVTWSHTEHGEDYGLDCTSCHHEDTDIEPEPQNCANCHSPLGDTGKKDSTKKVSTLSLRDAVHAKCQSCHEDMFSNGIKDCASCHTSIDNRKRLKDQGAEKFALNNAYANCAVCHTQKPGELIPDRMTAFHGQCITCHTDAKAGPYTSEQCNQCHTK